MKKMIVIIQSLIVRNMEINQSFSEKIGNIIIATFTSIILVLCIVAALDHFLPGWNCYNWSVPRPRSQELLSGLLIAPFTEELVFRWLPITLLKNTQFFKDRKYYFIGVLAVIFGYMHGSYYHVFVQGVAGFFFGWVYIKNNISYLSAAISHFLYNFICIVILPLLS